MNQFFYLTPILAFLFFSCKGKVEEDSANEDIDNLQIEAVANDITGNYYLPPLEEPGRGHTSVEN